MTAAEKAAYQQAFPEAQVATLTLPRHFKLQTPPSDVDSESDINLTKQITVMEESLPVPPPNVKYDTKPFFAPSQKSTSLSLITFH